MALTVKNKIWLGTLFLFLLLVIMGGMSVFYVAKLKSDARTILQDNYESLDYSHTMQEKLDSLTPVSTTVIRQFENVLTLQENNITEPGEDVATGLLRKLFTSIKNGDTSASSIKAMQKQIGEILAVNMSAIERKNTSARKTADDALTYIILLASVIFVIAFTFIINFPSIVTQPIRKLTEGINEIASRNYKHRIHIKNQDEFGKMANAFNDMAERLEHFESSNLNQIMFEKSRAEAVINSLKDASIGVDKNNKVLFANFQALQLLGMKAEDMVGKPAMEITERNDLFRFLIENESSSPFKAVVDNRENYFVKEIIDVEQGDTKNKVIVIKNITSYKELDVAKTNFIATISHELKTPLASSDFSLKLLEDERVSSLSAEQKELISHIKDDNQRMLKILSELLNMSQVEAGRIQLNVTMVDPTQLIEHAIKTIAGNAINKEITILNTSPKNLPLIKADGDKTTWVLNNFLSNAVKYSFRNSIIEVSANPENGKVSFSVQDHGPGIAKEYLPRLFERYFQVPGSTEKGNGLGLAISKEFIEAQGGQVNVNSEIGKGSCFIFDLPIE